MADTFTMTFSGGQELAAALRALPRLALVQSTIRSAEKKALDPVKRRAWELARKLTGDMADSIDTRSVRSGPDSVTVGVGPDKQHFYGMFHEFGTAKLGAKPFLRPAWDERGADQILSDLGTELWAAIERTTRRLGKA